MARKIALAAAILLALLSLAIPPAFANQDTLTVHRSEDRLSASASWPPVQGVPSQLFFYVGKLLLGEESAAGISVNLATYKEVRLDAGVGSLDISGLDPARQYLYGVAGAATDADGKRVWKDLAFAGLPSPTSAATDRAALIALYNAADGDNWRENANWLSDAPLSEWSGVKTDADGRVVELDLWLNKMSGELPPELGDLAELRRLSLPLNRLSGELPSELGALSNLEELILIGNKFTGEIPVQYGGLFNLQKLYLSVGDNFTGCIPAALQNAPTNDLSELSLPFCP